MFKLKRKQCESCIYFTETIDCSTGKSSTPVCGWSIATFRGVTNSVCRNYELKKKMK
jgi:hypothetical protein